MRVSAGFKQDIENCLEVLKKGGIILYPTDTIWGLGCDATDPEAVKKIYRIKQREDSRAMLVLMENENLLERYVREIPEVAPDLIGMSIKPLTIIYPGAMNLAPNLIAEDGSIGIRISREEFSSELIRRFRKPIVSTSANISGEPAAGNFSEISEKIRNAADYIVKFRQEETKRYPASGIIKLGPGGQIKVIRE